MKLLDLLKEENLDYLYKGDKKLVEKGFKDVDHYLKAMSIDLGKAGHKKQSIEFQRFYKKHWIEKPPIPADVKRFMTKFIEKLKGKDLSRIKQKAILFKVVKALGISPQELMMYVQRVKKEI